MFTRNLFKHFLTFSLFALLFIPQISGPGSAFAAGPSSEKDPPEVHCLSSSGSMDEGGVVGPSDSPPGQEVDLTVYIDTMNNCSQTVTGIIHGGVARPVCAGAGVADPVNLRFPLSGNLASEQHDGETFKATVKCIISVNNVPTSSAVPLSVSMVVTAEGTTASGQLASANPITLALTWS